VNFENLRFLIPPLWPDTFEILLVAYVLYRFLLYLVGTRAIQIMLGLVVFVVAYFGALFAEFTMITQLLGVLVPYAAFAAIVVFQPELRSALARLGQARWVRAFARDRQSVTACRARGRAPWWRSRATSSWTSTSRPAPRSTPSSPPICSRPSLRRTRRCTTVRS
jgi:hypothetical protein